MLHHVEGAAEEGAETRSVAARGTPAEREFTGRVVAVRPAELLLTEGGDPALFFGRHRWELRADGPGTVLVNREEFTGPLVPEVLAGTRDVLVAEFTAFNESLKARAEADARGWGA
ncbi:SRPBCC family protein [Actinokineospora soli]|uniref:SRPBCC family protein n=1 Tax=Actinokineospora soli TaxID=1048753 RepID=A0ABW2TUC6_9PSEU